jgi:hypothetical protein
MLALLNSRARSASLFVPLALIAILCGCEGARPGPSPTREGQASPGRPDPSGIPKAPSGGGIR